MERGCLEGAAALLSRGYGRRRLKLSLGSLLLVRNICWLGEQFVRAHKIGAPRFKLPPPSQRFFTILHARKPLANAALLSALLFRTR
jgi:hypothetical protein